jgi:DNA repair protein RadD
MQLRPYQLEAVAAVYQHLETRNDNPCIVLPTGSGKTPVIAQLCADAVRQWNGRVLVLAHVKELLEQTADKLRAICPDVSVGVYSAGLGSRETAQPVIVAGIQSVYEKACELGRFDLVIVDEAHLIPPDGEGMYRRLLSDLLLINPQLRIVGLTATPFRLTSGPICSPDGLLNEVCYEVGVKQLIIEGYLSPLISKRGRKQADTSGLHIRAGEFIASEVEALMEEDALVDAACQEIVELAGNRKSILIFCSGVQHAETVSAALSLLYGLNCRLVTAETPPADRASAIAQFKSGALQCLVNVNVLTTGFDAPNVDCIVLLRPTLSPGLYYQMVGRGFRIFPGKENCLVLDFGGNVKRHGPIDSLRLPNARGPGAGGAPVKECPSCRALVAAGFAICPVCGVAFPPPERQLHDPTATTASVLSEIKVERLPVRDVLYSIHRKRNQPDALPSMRVDYQVAVGQYKSEWICFEHEGFAREKAVSWWRKRSPDPVPNTIEEAVTAAKNGALAETLAIVVRSDTRERFDRITDYELGEMPEPLGAADIDNALSEPARDSFEEVPF